MGFFKEIFKRSSDKSKVLLNDEKGGEGSGGVAMSDMDENDITQEFTREEMAAMARGEGGGRSKSVEGSMGMQHFGYKTVSGMGERGGVDYSDSRAKGEAYISEQKKLMKETNPDDQARIRRASERIAAVRRDLNRS